MSALPLLLRIIDEFDRKSISSYYGNNFDLALSPYLSYRNPQRESNFNTMESLNLLSRLSENETSRYGERKEFRISSIGKEGFQVCMDVAHFKPNELNVKVVDNSIVVEGKHEEREDQHGFIQRHFVRRYVLPKGYDADKVVSTLSSDGVLTVTVPKPQETQKSNERIIQIQQTGPAHLNVKHNTQEKVGNASKDEQEENQ